MVKTALQKQRAYRLESSKIFTVRRCWSATHARLHADKIHANTTLPIMNLFLILFKHIRAVRLGRQPRPKLLRWSQMQSCSTVAPFSEFPGEMCITISKDDNGLWRR